jgi:hypothetical protein
MDMIKTFIARPVNGFELALKKLDDLVAMDPEIRLCKIIYVQDSYFVNDKEDCLSRTVVYRTEGQPVN